MFGCSLRNSSASWTSVSASPRCRASDNWSIPGPAAVHAWSWRACSRSGPACAAAVYRPRSTTTSPILGRAVRQACRIGRWQCRRRLRIGPCTHILARRCGARHRGTGSCRNRQVHIRGERPPLDLWAAPGPEPAPRSTGRADRPSSPRRRPCRSWYPTDRPNKHGIGHHQGALLDDRRRRAGAGSQPRRPARARPVGNARRLPPCGSESAARRSARRNRLQRVAVKRADPRPGTWSSALASRSTVR